MAEYKRRGFLFGLLIISAMIIISSSIKYIDVSKNEAIENIEASYHSLLIAKSLNEGSISEHHLLPVVTQGGDVNKGIPWGASVRDKSGSYIYTSFPSLGFLIPATFIKALGLNYSVMSILFLNILIMTSSALLFFVTLLNVFKPQNHTQAILIALACSPLILSRESLASTGLLYWPQSLSQLFIAAFAFSICKIIVSNKSSWVMASGFSLYFLCMTEWTGYVIGGLSAIYFLVSKKRRDVSLAFAMLASIFLAAITFSIQLYMTLDLGEFISASITRFSVRSGGDADFRALFAGYYQSYGLFLIVIPVFIASKLMNKGIRNDLANLMVILLAFSLIENIILAQHATSYTFDRLKLSFVISIMMCQTFLVSKGKWLFAPVTLTIISCILSFATYRSDVSQFRSWKDVQTANIAIASKALAVEGYDCASIYNSTRVRAYLNLIMGRSVWERLPTENEKNAKGECPIIVINGDIPFKDLQRITSIDVYRGGLLERKIH